MTVPVSACLLILNYFSFHFHSEEAVLCAWCRLLDKKWGLYWFVCVRVSACVPVCWNRSLPMWARLASNPRWTCLCQPTAGKLYLCHHAHLLITLQEGLTDLSPSGQGLALRVCGSTDVSANTCVGLQRMVRREHSLHTAIFFQLHKSTWLHKSSDHYLQR